MLWPKGLVVGTVDVSNRVLDLRSNLEMAGRGSLLLLCTWNPGRFFFWCVHQLGLMHNARGPFGAMDWLDGLANHRALIDGRPILSVFETTAGDRFCIVTRQDESVTTVMLDDESPLQTSSTNL